MMKFLFLFAIFSLILNHHALSLVHFKQLQPGAEGGCEGDKGAIKKGEFVKDESVCGVIVCQNDQGDALIHYCQIPTPIPGCLQQGVDTTLDFPVCCWICCEWTNCGNTRSLQLDPADYPSPLQEIMSDVAEKNETSIGAGGVRNETEHAPPQPGVHGKQEPQATSAPNDTQ